MNYQEKHYGRYTDISHIYGINKNTLYTLVHRELIPHYRVSKRLVLFSFIEIESWIKSGALNPLEKNPCMKGGST